MDLRTLIEAWVPDDTAYAFEVLCTRTGLRWGPSPPDLFWFRSPKENLFEFILLNTVVMILAVLSRGYYATAIQRPESLYTSPRTIYGSRAPGSASVAAHVGLRVLNGFFGVILVFCWLSQVVFKAIRPTPFIQLGWLLMPCHLITLGWIYVLLPTASVRAQGGELDLVRRYNRRVYVATLLVSFWWAPTAALAAPDHSDHQLRVEALVFYLHHALLVVLPWFYALCHQLLPLSAAFELHATAVATHINVFWYAIIAYLTGLNLNYQLYPPRPLLPKPSQAGGAAVSSPVGTSSFSTPFYRLYVIPLLVALTFLGHAVGIHVFQRMGRCFSRSLSNKDAAKPPSTRAGRSRSAKEE